MAIGVRGWGDRGEGRGVGGWGGDTRAAPLDEDGTMDGGGDAESTASSGNSGTNEDTHGHSGAVPPPPTVAAFVARALETQR